MAQAATISFRAVILGAHACDYAALSHLLAKGFVMRKATPNINV
jgi:hypothetical protein